MESKSGTGGEEEYGLCTDCVRDMTDIRTLSFLDFKYENRQCSQLLRKNQILDFKSVRLECDLAYKFLQRRLSFLNNKLNQRRNNEVGGEWEKGKAGAEIQLQKKRKKKKRHEVINMDDKVGEKNMQENYSQKQDSAMANK